MPEMFLESNYNYFLETDLENYKGEWIAIFNNSILSHNKDLKKVVEEAKKESRGRKFLLVKVPSQETMIF